MFDFSDHAVGVTSPVAGSHLARALLLSVLPATLAAVALPADGAITQLQIKAG
jgi:hypothetical protein